MACQTTVLQWQSVNVGRLVRGIRPVDGLEGISPAPGDHRSGGSGASRCGLSVPIQHFWTVRHAMADFYQRGNGQRQAIWGQWVLVGEVTRDVHDALGVSGLRQAGGEPFDGVSEMADASESRRLLRRDGAECGAVQENEFADPDDYWTLRRRSAGGVHVLQAAHAVRNGGSKG